jgi:hypothetical protein
MVMKGLGRTWVAAFFVVSVGVALPHSAQAGDPVGKLSASLRMGLNGYAMGPVNDGISRTNRLLKANPGSADWELPDRLHSGFNLGGDLNFDISPMIRVGIVYGTTWGSSSVDFREKITIEPRSRFAFPRALVRLPIRPSENISLRAFAGPLFLLRPETKISHENTSESAKRLDSIIIKGSGTGFAGGIAGEYTLGDRFSLTFEGGYQFAKASFDSGEWSITGLTDPLGDDDGDGVPNNRDPVGTSYLWGFFNERYQDPELGQQTERPPTVRQDLDIDFSGFLLQAGFRVYLF